MTQKQQVQIQQPQNLNLNKKNINLSPSPNKKSNTNKNTKINQNLNKIGKGKFTLLKKNIRGQKRIRTGLLRQPVFQQRLHLQIKTKILKTNIKWISNIKITPNNIIVALTDRSGKLKFLTSAGKLGLACSKRTLKFVVKMVLTHFFNHLKKIKIFEAIYFRITAPKHYRRRILKTLMKKEIRAGKNLLEGLAKLPFNGCRPPKERRKKRKGLRIFKT